MNIIVTCGPSYEPIDQVRRITNFSTGRLGITLANTLTDSGHRVFCLKGEQSTDPTPLHVHRTISFSTNDDLAQKLQSLTGENIDVIFHAAALADFNVASVENSAGQKITSAKFPTRGDNLILTLAPAAKILPQLHRWFPKTKIVGWKYELEGTRDEAIAKALQQITDAHTSACVLNGAAYGTGFLFCAPFSQTTLATLPELCSFLNRWLRPQ